MRRRLTHVLWPALALALPLALAGCPCDCDTVDTEDTELPPPLEVHLYGGAAEVFAGAPVPVGLCVDAIDPQEALDGGELEILASAEVDTEGAYLVQDVDVTDANVALFLSVRDCDPGGGAVFPTATGMPPEMYADAEPGDFVQHDIVFLSAESKTGLDQSLALLNETRTLDVGAMAAFVLDETGAPIAGATVASDAFAETVCYYVDADPSDGMLSTAGAPNTSTQAGVGLALCVGPFVGAVQVTAEGYAFDIGLFGALPGMLSVTAWTAK